MRMIDTLINARWVVPVEPPDTVLEHHAVAIDQGRIVDILPCVDAERRYQARSTHHFDSHALIPGLINAHTHAAMSLFRGLADDLPLMTWLKEHIWPAENRWVNETFVYDGTALAAAEMLRGGVTCFNDMYFFPEVAARAAVTAGMRACVGLIVIDFPTVYASNADEYISRALTVHDEYKGDALITTAFAPHAPYTVSDDALRRVRTFADELDIPVHMHVHETADEIGQSIATHGGRPLQRLAGLGLVSPSLLAVHMTQLTDADIEQVAGGGAHVLHCPESNLKLASGFCPVHQLMRAGVNVALGTDGAASNNDLDMFAEMRTAALLAKAVAGDATTLPAAAALRMATLNGAIALGLGEQTGSLIAGKSADIVAVELDRIEATPLYDPVSQLIYATGRNQVTDVWVAGQQVLQGRRLTNLDEAEIRAKACEWSTRIRELQG
ncbi:MAG: TRZ/ATZ family hydrolase [Gammaproteobacteria bacterium]|nr:TRZ/ATZ family hydrolase [Gammaproteobacteria bacterium]